MADTQEPAPTHTIVFPEPIDFGNTKYDHMVLTEPSIENIEAAYRAVGKDEVTGSLRLKSELMSAVSKVPVDVIRKLKVRQHGEAWDYLSLFLG